jgi:hypothetical protein
MKWQKLINGEGRLIITTDVISDDSDGPTDCQKPTLTKGPPRHPDGWLVQQRWSCSMGATIQEPQSRMGR